MVFERRAYTFRPGMIEKFWQAQEEWNTPDIYGVVLDHNLSYFSTIAGPSDQIIQLYKFQSLDHWRGAYEKYYATQNPEYFRLVRTCMLQQENGFFIAPPAPVTDLALHLTASPPTLPEAAAAAASKDVAHMCVTETILDLLPGGLPAFWAACEAHNIIAHPIDAPHRVGTLFTLIGRIHRVIQYRGYASVAEAQTHRAALNADPAWQDFVAAHHSWVAGSLTHFLRPAPWPRMRTMWGKGR